MASYHNTLFPEEISYGSKGGPRFLTTIVTLASGKERRNIEWSKVRSFYDVSHGIKDPDQMLELRNFFYARFGRAYSFKFRDWGDCEIFNQNIGVGDGVKTKFQVIKSYISGPGQYDRTITKLKGGSVLPIKVNGVPKVEDTDYTIDYTDGTVTFAVAPANGFVINMPYAFFYVHVRFDIDDFDPKWEFWQYQSWESIPLVEIKDDN
jgi:uncharacterized protein (TIGR02217 family)